MLSQDDESPASLVLYFISYLVCQCRQAVVLPLLNSSLQPQSRTRAESQFALEEEGCGPCAPNLLTHCDCVGQKTSLSLSIQRPLLTQAPLLDSFPVLQSLGWATCSGIRCTRKEERNILSGCLKNYTLTAPLCHYYCRTSRRFSRHYSRHCMIHTHLFPVLLSLGNGAHYHTQTSHASSPCLLRTLSILDFLH